METMLKEIKRYIMTLLLTTCLLTLSAQRHTEFVHLSLEQSPEELAEKLSQKGLQREDGYELSGRIMGLEVWLHIEANKDTTGCSYLMVTTQVQQGVSQHEDYVKLMRWMQKHYGKPTWEGMVRSHAFARWFVDFDRDIVMIATASSAVEIWFYDNHQKRNIDYYAILKYCERHPVDNIPYYSAQQQVTWKSAAPVVTERKAVKVSRHGRHSAKRHSSRHRSKRHRRR